MLTKFLKTMGTLAQKTSRSGQEAAPAYVVVPLPTEVERRTAASDGTLSEDVLRSRKGTTVIFDGSACRHIDSYGIGLLVQQHTIATRCGAKFVVVLPHGRVRRALELTRVNTLFPVFDSVADAVASISDPSSLPAPVLQS